MTEARRIAVVDAGLLMLAVSLAYAKALAGPFQFDDYTVIVQADAVHGWAAWWDDLGHGLRPLLKLSYLLDWLAGFGAPGFHFTNLVIHALNVWLVRGLVKHAVSCWLPALDAGSARRAALLAALIFALHPANTEAVSYICARSVSLMGLLMLACLRVHRLESPLGSLAASWTLFGFALAVKEPAAMLPLLMWLGDRYGIGRQYDSRRAALLRYAPYALLLLGLLLGFVPQSRYREFLLGSLGARAIDDNLWSQIGALRYLLELALLWRVPNIDPELAEAQGYAPSLLLQALAGLALLVLALRSRRPWLGWGLLWFVLQLLPTNSLLPRNDLVNDRQLYLAGIGLWTALAVELASRGLLRRPWLAASGIAGLALVIGAATVARNRDYGSEVALWRATTLASPGKARPWNNLGYALQLAGCRQQALMAYERALALDPEHERARHNRDALLALKLPEACRES